MEKGALLKQGAMALAVLDQQWDWPQELAYEERKWSTNQSLGWYEFTYVIELQ